jgi:hypothetical protein
MTPGSTYRPATLQPPCLGREPRLGLRHDNLTIDCARHGTNPNESRDVGAIAQHRARKAHGLPQFVERCVFGVVTNASEPLIRFAPRDGGVIGLPHRTHKLHEDCASPPILENGSGTCHMSNMFESEVG